MHAFLHGIGPKNCKSLRKITLSIQDPAEPKEAPSAALSWFSDEVRRCGELAFIALLRKMSLNELTVKFNARCICLVQGRSELIDDT